MDAGLSEVPRLVWGEWDGKESTDRISKRVELPAGPPAFFGLGLDIRGKKHTGSRGSGAVEEVPVIAGATTIWSYNYCPHR